MDVLVDKSGRITTLIVGVGGFLGAGEKDVAVPFGEVHPTMKNKTVVLGDEYDQGKPEKRAWL